MRVYNEEHRDIHNKFGSFAINTSQRIFIPFGLIGIPTPKYYCIALPKNPKFRHFALLQSTEVDTVVFLVLPLSMDNHLIDKIDLVSTRMTVGIEEENLQIFLVVASKIIEGEKKMVTNTRAPIFIDTLNRVGIQYVLQNNDYQSQYILDDAIALHTPST